MSGWKIIYAYGEKLIEAKTEWEAVDKAFGKFWHGLTISSIQKLYTISSDGVAVFAEIL